MCCFLPQISAAVLASGEHLGRKFRVQNHSPLMYEWYQELYVGAAHGLAGIYYYLMQVNGAGWRFSFSPSYCQASVMKWPRIKFQTDSLIQNLINLLKTAPNLPPAASTCNPPSPPCTPPPARLRRLGGARAPAGEAQRGPRLSPQVPLGELPALHRG